MFYALIILAALARLLPHPPNFAPIGALGLFAGAYLNKRCGWAVPLLALLAGDLFLGFYNPIVMACVYGGFALSGLVGRVVLRRRCTCLRLTVCSLTSAVGFFLLSNFGCWLAGMYPPTWAGLTQCYVMALPFLRNTLFGDLFYSAVLFGGYEAAQQWARKRQEVHKAYPSGRPSL